MKKLISVMVIVLTLLFSSAANAFVVHENFMACTSIVKTTLWFAAVIESSAGNVDVSRKLFNAATNKPSGIDLDFCGVVLDGSEGFIIPNSSEFIIEYNDKKAHLIQVMFVNKKVEKAAAYWVVKEFLPEDVDAYIESNKSSDDKEQEILF